MVIIRLGRVNQMDAKTIIKKAMKHQNIKSGVLAGLLGMDYQAFCNKLSRGTMSANYMVEIANALGCDVVFRDRATGEIID